MSNEKTTKPSLEDPQTDEQLKDVTIIIGVVDYNDDGNPYASSRVYRGDLEGNIEEFIESLSDQVVEISPMKNFDPTTENQGQATSEEKKDSPKSLFRVWANGEFRDCDVNQRSEDCIEITHSWDIPEDEDGDRPKDLEDSYRMIATHIFGFTHANLDERDPNTMWVWNRK